MLKGKPIVHVAFLDAGQGDTTIISVPERQEAVIVDCVDADAVLRYLEHKSIKHIRGVIITHLHLDHYRGVIDLLENASCERLLFDWPRVSSKFLAALLNDSDKHARGSGDKKLSRLAFQSLLDWRQKNWTRYNTLASSLSEKSNASPTD